MNIESELLYIIMLAAFVTFIASLVGVYFYTKIAFKKGIISNPNYRTLHEKPMPRGGGVVFASSFIIGLFLFWYFGSISTSLFLILGIGGLAAAFSGFLDDIKNLRASRKLILQLLLSSWVVYLLGGGPLLFITYINSFVLILLTIIFLTWIINAYNFMDGIDGMATSGAIFVFGTMLLVLFLTSSNVSLIIVFILLLSSVGAFMFFNWPPATIFMGDSGSIFLGYTFGSLILITIESGDISVWSWLIVFSYFFADTTVTQVMRLILVKKWYLAHRSHAYQNLARITQSHLKIVKGLMLYNVLWVLPLTLWSALQPQTSLLAAVIAIFPRLIIAYKYGPLLSSS